jgi:hypothetical protein
LYIVFTSPRTPLPAVRPNYSNFEAMRPSMDIPTTTLFLGPVKP